MGGGGDDGASQRQAEIERQKQAARSSINAMFGVDPSRPELKAPGLRENSLIRKQLFEPQDAAAMARYQAGMTEAEKNRIARDELYDKVRGDAFTAGRRQLDEGAQDAARKLKFALFSSGLNGSSVDVDENALLKRTTDKGMLDLGARADAAEADLRGNDEQTRLGLLQSVDAGMDQGSALSSALNQLRINSDKASAAAQGTSIGDLFGNAGLLYQRQQQQLGRQQARNDYSRSTGGGSYQGSISTTGG